MGVVQVPDELHRLIEQQVADGRASSQAAFLEAVTYLLNAADRQQDEIDAVVRNGRTDIQAGRYTRIATSTDEQQLRDRLEASLQAALAANE